MGFEVNKKDIASLIQAVQDSDLTRFQMTTSEFEIYISRSEDELEFSRNSNSAAATQIASSTVSPPEPAPEQPSSTSPKPTFEQVAERSSDLVDVNARMIGIFYGAPEPGADPYIKVGSTVGKDTTVGLVEAMKLFTAVEAGIEGTVEEILVANGDYVEYGQTLVRVRPADSQGS